MSTAWHYTALGVDGQLRQGQAEGEAEAHVVAELRKAGLTPVRIVRATGAKHRTLSLSLSWRRRGLSRRAVTEITRELALMLAAGLDLDRALRFLVETVADVRAREVLEEVRDAMRGGGAFATALTQRPESFTPLYIGLVRAGESGGALGDALERLATLMERERSLNSAIQSALIYPAILVIASVGSVVLLLTQVLPQFVPLFEEAGAQLPMATQIVIAAGSTLSHWGLALLLGVVLGAFALRALLGNPSFRLVWDRMVLRLPVLGTLARDIMAARLTRTLGTLLQNGMPLLGALRICEDVIGNRAGVQAVEAAAVVTRAGGGLARPLAAAGVFPGRTIHLLQLGEETAQIGPLALRAAELHEEAARIGLQRLVALLVPAITVIMGAIVAGIVSALLLAMLGLNDLAK